MFYAFQAAILGLQRYKKFYKRKDFFKKNHKFSTRNLNS